MAEKWTAAQLQEFSEADDMKVSPFYSDGKTYGTPTWIWSVVTNDNLYVRAYNGQNSSWYQAAMQQGAGKIHLAGQDYEVKFERVANTPELDHAISAAYQTKYAKSPYLPPMLKEGPVGATVKIIPNN
ncbi:DUF2255 family protein [Fructilactobacillus carniphilus]|uniref:DUF2255 family protein n=1 Tax=Fructilactobacillus carniphilus TaxID=2940297 RepID=A0ABY5BXM1_9LACO|nr:DUF2255 family protein [Fructilactobacillus carniphilus]USS90585.1 DUF2255 family protein [Fructilactobacillus carniphilus]